VDSIYYISNNIFVCRKVRIDYIGTDAGPGFSGGMIREENRYIYACRRCPSAGNMLR
jgi:hypothetical protein